MRVVDIPSAVVLVPNGGGSVVVVLSSPGALPVGVEAFAVVVFSDSVVF